MAGPKSYESDELFFVDEGQGLQTGCTLGSHGPLVIELPISRYIGPVDAEGRLTGSPPTGLPDSLTLLLQDWDVDYDGDAQEPTPERDSVVFNGEFIGYLKGANNTEFPSEFSLPIDHFRFPDKGAAPGDTVVPRINTIVVYIDVRHTGVWCTAIDRAAIRLRAPRPTLLLNGWAPIGGSLNGPQVWQAEWIPALNENSIPNHALALPRRASVNESAQIITQFAPQFKAQYGVSRFNIVAHSKGGLDAMEFLQSHDDASTFISLLLWQV